MKEVTCKRCGTVTVGTESREFCSTKCRVAYWQKEQRKAKKILKRISLPKPKEETVEQAQLRVLASMITLRDAALKNDEFAIKVLREIDNFLGNISQEIKK